MCVKRPFLSNLAFFPSILLTTFLTQEICGNRAHLLKNALVSEDSEKIVELIVD
jgi:hypothetical protein